VTQAKIGRTHEDCNGSCTASKTRPSLGFVSLRVSGDFLMAKKRTYEELKQRVKELENEAFERKKAEEMLRKSEEKYRNL
jgi:hypothetical protein